MRATVRRIHLHPNSVQARGPRRIREIITAAAHRPTAATATRQNVMHYTAVPAGRAADHVSESTQQGGNTVMVTTGDI